MNYVSNKLFLVLVSVAFFAAGCTKKPTRPSPDQTMMGPGPGGTSGINPMDVITGSDVPGLDPRNAGGIDPNAPTKGIVQPVYFDFNASNIKASERPKLQEAAKYLKDHPGTRLLLEGHCDWRGTDEYNLGLGDRRAKAAKTYLVSLGVPEVQLETLSKGSLEAAKNADESVASKDRRVEVLAQTR